MSDHLLVLTTLPDQAQAERVATRLVEDGLAACVNVLPPMTSIYRWEGELQRGTEHLLVIKTTASRYVVVEETLGADHPYELPEIIATPITRGLEAYLAWIGAQTC